MTVEVTVQDVVNRWRPLSAAETTVAETLLDDALNIVELRWPDIHERAFLDLTTSRSVVRVVAGMVRRAMLNRNSEGITQDQESAGGLSYSSTYSNPNNNLYLSADDVRALEPDGYTSKVKVGWLA